jgi:hypothetical protein
MDEFGSGEAGQFLTASVDDIEGDRDHLLFEPRVAAPEVKQSCLNQGQHAESHAFIAQPLHAQ